MTAPSTALVRACGPENLGGHGMPGVRYNLAVATLARLAAATGRTLSLGWDGPMGAGRDSEAASLVAWHGPDWHPAPRVTHREALVSDPAVVPSLIGEEGDTGLWWTGGYDHATGTTLPDLPATSGADAATVAHALLTQGDTP